LLPKGAPEICPLLNSNLCHLATTKRPNLAIITKLHKVWSTGHATSGRSRACDALVPPASGPCFQRQEPVVARAAHNPRARRSTGVCPYSYGQQRVEGGCHLSGSKPQGAFPHTSSRPASKQWQVAGCTGSRTFPVATPTPLAPPIRPSTGIWYPPMSAIGCLGSVLGRRSATDRIATRISPLPASPARPQRTTYKFPCTLLKEAAECPATNRLAAAHHPTVDRWDSQQRRPCLRSAAQCTFQTLIAKQTYQLHVLALKY
jgi:hypothetical protein